MAIIMLFAMSACESTENIEETKVEVPTENTILFIQPGEKEVSTEKVNNVLSERNIRIEVRTYPEETYDEKIELLIESDLEFDLFYYTQDMPKLSYMKNNEIIKELVITEELRALFPEEYWEKVSVNTQVVGIPVMEKALNGFNDSMGYTSNSAEKFDTDDILLSIVELNSDGKIWINGAFGIPTWLHRTYETYPFTVENYLGLIKIDKDNNISSFYESEEFKSDAEYFRNFYESGLISEDILTGGEVEGLQSQSVLPSQGFSETSATNENIKFESIGRAPLTFTDTLSSGALCIPNTSEKDVITMEFLNALYSDREVYDSFHYGEEDVDYSLDSSGRITKNNVGFPNEVFTVYAPYKRYHTSVSLEYINAISLYDSSAVVMDSSYFRFDDTGLKNVMANLENVVLEEINPIKIGAESYEENIGEAINKLYSAGFKRYFEEYQKQYNDFILEQSN